MGGAVLGRVKKCHPPTVEKCRPPTVEKCSPTHTQKVPLWVEPKSVAPSPSLSGRNYFIPMYQAGANTFVSGRFWGFPKKTPKCMWLFAGISPVR